MHKKYQPLAGLIARANYTPIRGKSANKQIKKSKKQSGKSAVFFQERDDFLLHLILAHRVGKNVQVGVLPGMRQAAMLL